MSNVMGDRIKELREARGMTQEELGEKIGVQKSAIRKYEKGSVENIKRSAIKIMSELFQVSPLYLMGLDDSANRPSPPPPRPSYNVHERSMIAKYRSLDKHGKRTVDTVLDLEYDRCNEDFDADDIQILAAHVSDRPDINEPDR